MMFYYIVYCGFKLVHFLRVPNIYMLCCLRAGAPVVLTLPHMLNADLRYRTVLGLHPDDRKHRIFVDIEPVSG